MKKVAVPYISLILVFLVFTSCNSTERPNHSPENGQRDQADRITEKDYFPGTGYTLVWADEFEAAALDTTSWNRQVLEAGRFNEEWQRYTGSTENAYLKDGSLVIEAIHTGDKHGPDQYTSARLNTANKQSWKYGRIAARIKLPHGEGIWPAFWMLGANISENGGDTPWPQSGEIDILELYGSKDDGAVEANIHYADAEDNHAMMGAVTFELEEGRFADDFHIFELQWDADSIAWLVDGQQYASVNITDPVMSEFHKEHFILLNVAVGGTWAGRPDETTVFPQKMVIDWVRVHQKL